MTKFVAFVSGKGGVGKTTTTLNVGQALAQQGKKVILLDANLSTPNLAIHLGMMNLSGTVNKFMHQEKGLNEVIYKHESGISLIPASPSYEEFQKTNPQKLTEVFEHLDNMSDFVLIDAPSGLGYEVNQILKHSDESVIVVNPNLSSVMEALKTIQLSKEQGSVVAGIVLNMSNKGKNELSQQEVEQILGYPIIANIREHKKVKKAAYRQMPLNYLYSRSKPAKGFAQVAKHLSLENDQ